MRSSWAIAIALTIALGAWLASPYYLPAREAVINEGELSEASPTYEVLMRVQTRVSHAEPVRRELVLNGRSEASRRVILRAEIDARVIDLPLDKGDMVGAGALIASLDKRDKVAWEIRAAAMLKEYEIAYEASRRLGQKGFQAETQVARSLAQLEEARATLAQSRINLDHTSINASFAGVVEDRMVEVGDFVKVGDPIAEVVELDPLIVAADVPEMEFHRFVGQTTAQVVMVGFGRHEGRVHFLASEADPQTRTFHIEIELPNLALKLPAGITTEVHLAFDAEEAHRIEPSQLTLDDAGRIGIKTVNAVGLVAFEPAEIVKSDVDALWLAGLPDEVEVITLGQGFVKAGEKVETVREDSDAPEDDALLARQ